MLRFLILLIALVPAPLAAQDRAATEKQFRGWLEQTVWPRARGAGVARGTFETALSGVTLDWALPDLVPPGAPAQPRQAQRQAEFGSPDRYFRRGAVDGATSVGRQMAARHAETLRAVERATGVPSRILLAIWGRESGYGRAAIPHDAFRVLATKGFMGRREAYFTDELVAALRIAQAGHAPSRAMKSSWAGALGQPQFMPSSFLKYAADGDGDGRADIWRSEADTLASIGNYLARHGWVAGRDWGFEVRVPADVSCALEGPDQGRLIRDWAAMGISRVSGKPFPDHEAAREGYLLMPAGRHGPAFIVTPNFYALKSYNMSDLYALFVGHVGDRIAYGMGDFEAGWGRVGGLMRSDVAAMQRALEAMGHDVGGADGLAGYKTRRSIGRWQQASGRPATCFPDTAMRGALAR
ncbi:lytic murein transglycosylase [Limimaricola hongkongensis]|uniref:Membrane-bound lytic murein transglycosylase B n=1 Tax=Limimaricola hongkongensis DSM 17492 TaxID=1122180 RepID=A0A017HBM7_9RHOB|nr:lytic murein transglycosylase [Limimaricola hongkongensis]EYD71184.1 Membrane-bound lytic murein transglycosylase B precursor [Limimaricola hongkongensis DSM 17492]